MTQNVKALISGIVILGIGFILWVMKIDYTATEDSVIVPVITWVSVEITQDQIIEIVDLIEDKFIESNAAAVEAEVIASTEETLTEVEVVEAIEAVEVATQTSDDLFGVQPKKAIWNYAGNSDQLNTFAHNNTVAMYVPENSTSMTVVLKKDVTDSGRNLVVYVESESRHCGGRILWANLWDVKWNIFNFNLLDMDIQGSGCDGDRSKNISGKDIKISWYITTYDGNGISEIIFN